MFHRQDCIVSVAQSLSQAQQKTHCSSRRSKVRLFSSRSKTSWDNTCCLLRRSVPMSRTGLYILRQTFSLHTKGCDSTAAHSFYQDSVVGSNEQWVCWLRKFYSKRCPRYCLGIACTLYSRVFILTVIKGKNEQNTCTVSIEFCSSLRTRSMIESSHWGNVCEGGILQLRR